ncbi:MAG TPA: hypothetical protein RMH85_20655 [Polyangiaceae bacterium LLY-WYZ-15_(1-7)]|nr:hypothetical protein [Sandaracinus sp.]HJL06208.1 hypothetical protein [Polyangiaceae bacterium LLY-WYZ-15_(1-7)]HJL10897.1 hypothetical protein [Polyangiaceae bacterium LLY-WYZ-15_(1-7)]HJL27180.1 hypothetical protein [Polyangiaceae bacterium LLY-WYZ-15_(1-7)]HJL32362.1 hypothetical protein [Polyangiaceae bacterium LLY-WYZ-15_(1-7)]
MRRLLVLALLLLFARPAGVDARRSETEPYRYEQVWGSVIRLLRADYGFPVRDRDRDVGYVLFDYVDRGRSHPGNVQLVRVREGRQEKVRVTLNIPAMPSYIEGMVLERLSRKLRAEFGEPLPPPPEEAPVEEPEEDEDEGEGAADDES